MKCINGCCWGPFGARCCNVISIVGFVYFMFNFLIFPRQKYFYEFPITTESQTQTTFLVCSLIYLGCFIVTLLRIFYLNKKKKQAEKLTQLNSDETSLLNSQKSKKEQEPMIPNGKAQVNL